LIPPHIREGASFPGWLCGNILLSKADGLAYPDGDIPLLVNPMAAAADLQTKRRIYWPTYSQSMVPSVLSVKIGKYIDMAKTLLLLV